MKTLVIVSHPYPEHSHVIKALKETAESMVNVVVRDLEAIYATRDIVFNIAEEQDAYDGVDRVIFMYPTHWFNLTPNLKSYLNEVWSYGWAFGPDGHALKNKEMMVVTSAGAAEQMYSADGLIKSSMADVLAPMKASALYVGMKYLQPLVIYNAVNVSPERMNHLSSELVSHLSA
ncbi:NAD(P)H-dependent oxidoreductase [Kosakonia oryzae]|uniref:Glutathione-regulated potassium-efflux system ancillary protein KefF n=1 Tax=Kosakonia oryzae TaxID=497725 RepID=A0AA94KPX4_9ENTR|nr:NAD(P)H-dependent oxidoreductase [Kosakonia oryzae]ANI83045.1 NAD(P)H-dependent oxidoreductase [Kosakonia oryzae]SFC11458.1 glutathione-regulated potassium-efflux system ancillary protein KefF [Kosakonia oryzae]